MPAPTWLAATAGYSGYAGQVNQFLGAHVVTYVYGGATVISGGGSGTALYQSTAGLWLAQQFTASSSAQALALQLSAVGGSPASSLIPPLTLGVYADGSASGSPGPHGPAVASGVLTGEYVYSAPFWVPAYPLLSGLAAGSSYWLVTSPAGSGSHYYAWQEAASGTAAMTSANGTAWTAQTFSLLLEVTGAGSSLPLQGTAEDGGARITSLTWSAAGQLTGISEWTAAQGASGLAQSRAISYSGGLPAGVS